MPERSGTRPIRPRRMQRSASFNSRIVIAPCTVTTMGKASRRRRTLTVASASRRSMASRLDVFPNGRTLWESTFVWEAVEVRHQRHDHFGRRRHDAATSSTRSQRTCRNAQGP